jgi:hypothetical protein
VDKRLKDLDGDGKYHGNQRILTTSCEYKEKNGRCNGASQPLY